MKKNTFLLLTLLLFVTSSLTAVTTSNEARLLRFPDINGDQIVFSYSGDLYITNSAGGTARKLTSHQGYEMFAKFSPDGKQILYRTRSYTFNDFTGQLMTVSVEG